MNFVLGLMKHDGQKLLKEHKFKDKIKFVFSTNKQISSI